MRHETSPGQVFDPANTWEPTNPDYISPVLPIIDPVSLQGQPVPVRKWIVPQWIPSGAETMLSGAGGVGKSLLAMQLMTAAALGKQWIGQSTTPCRTLGVFCEDEPDELHRRQMSINTYYETEFTDLNDMGWLSRVGEESLMMTFDREEVGSGTEFFQQVHNATQDFGARLIVLDSLHDLFGGNENARSQERQFIGLLRSLALDCGGAVVLTAHPSLTGMSSGTGLSGSTAWNNAVRSRLYLTRPTVEEGQEVDDYERVLSRMKANYAPAGGGIDLRWHEGMFEAQVPETGILGTIERRTADKAFLDGLDALTRAGRNLSDSRNAGNYAARTISRTPQGKGFNVRQLEGAMERLFAGGEIRVEEQGRRGDTRRRIVRTEAPDESGDEP